MLQETTAATGANDAAAFQQMSFSHMITQFDLVAWVVFLTLVLFSVLSVYWIVVNMIRNARLHGRGDAKRLMDFREVVEHEMERHGVGVVLDLL